LRIVGYVIRRLLQMIPALLGITIVAFLFIKLLPGDPLQIMTMGKATPEMIAAERARLGLDQPLYIQYGLFVLNLLHGDLGTSIIMNSPVMEIIINRMAATLFLVVYAALIAILITIPLAYISAVHSDHPVDNDIRIGGMIFLGMPSFWLGLLFMLLFGLKLKMFPISGWGKDFGGHIYYLFLPALVIGLAMAPVLIQSLRESMLDVMQTDYIEVARAKGLKPLRVMFKHVLRNAVIPTITILSVKIGWLVSGAVVIETVFSIPGIGLLLIKSVLSRDYPMIQGLTLLFGLIVMVVNLLSDLSYAIIDPRIHYQ
jgi:ABC-type dipeptide/oligopeptide/nickel transport system permease component